MLLNTRAIVLKTVKYSETSVIAKLYTEQLGIQSYLVRGVRSGKSSASFKPAQLLTLNLLDIVAYHKQNTELQTIKEMRCTPALQSLHQHFVKTAVSMFMAELLHKSIVEEEPNSQLFNFVFDCIRHLDQTNESVAWLPCWFMVQLSSLLGFEPKGDVRNEEPFDMEEGVFTTVPGNFRYCIPHPLSSLLYHLKQSDFADYPKVEGSPKQRTELLEYMITYYKLHHLNIGEIKSHKVLAEVLA